MMRILLTGVSIVALLGVGAVVAPSFVDWNQYKPVAQEQIKKFTGHDVALNGDIKLSILPMPALHVHDVVVKAPAGSQSDVLASVQTLSATVELAPLFHKQIVVKAVNLDTPVINLESRADGTQNWMTPVLQESMAQKPQEENKHKKEKNVALQDVKIKNGSFRFVDGKKDSVVDVTGVNIAVSADSLAGPFTGKGDIVYGDKPITYDFKTGKISEDGKTLPLNVTLKAMGLDTTIKGEAQIKEPFSVQGETQVKAGSLSGLLKSLGAQKPAIPLPSDTFSVHGMMQADKSSMTIKGMKADIGGYALSGDVKAVFADMRVVGDIAAANLPGGAQVSGVVNAGLGKNLSVAADIKGSSPNIVQTIDGFAGAGKGAGLKAYKTGTFAAKLNMGDGALKITDGTAKLDNLLVAYAGTLQGKTLVLDKLKVNDYAGITADVTGKVADIQALNGLDIVVNASVPDVKATMSALQKDTKSLPKNLKSMDVKASIKGAKEAVDVDADIDVLGATFGAKGRVISPMDAPSVGALQMQVRHANAAGFMQSFAPGAPYYVSLERPMNVSFDLEQNGKAYKVTNLSGTVADTKIDGNITYDGGSAKPAISGNVHFGSLTLQTAQGQSKACCGAGKPQSSSGKWSTKPIDTKWMQAANVNLDISGQALTYETWNLKNPKLKFALNGGNLAIENMGADLYEGSMTLTGAVAPLSGGGVSVKLAPKMTSIQLEPLVGALAGNRIVKGRGDVNFAANLSGAGMSQAAIVKSLQGQGTTTGKDIVIEGLDLTRFARAMSEELKPGDALLNVWKGTTSGGSTEFDTLDGAFTVSSGIVNFTKLDLDGEKALLTTRGNVDLPAWRIKTAHEITLKHHPDIPPFTMNIDGPLDNPAQTFAQGAINDYFQRKLTRKLDKLIQDKGVADKLNKKLGNELGGIVGGFLGVPQQEAPEATTPEATTTPTVETPSANDNAAPASGATTGDSESWAPIQQEDPPAATSPAPAAPPDPETPEKPKDANDAVDAAAKALLKEFF